jgi:hypothetical protein
VFPWLSNSDSESDSTDEGQLRPEYHEVTPLSPSIGSCHRERIGADEGLGQAKKSTISRQLSFLLFHSKLSISGFGSHMPMVWSRFTPGVELLLTLVKSLTTGPRW